MAGTEQVLSLEGDFDATAFCRIREIVERATAFAPIVLDFRNVRACQPFALAELFEVLARSKGAARARGLSRRLGVAVDLLDDSTT